MVPILISIGGNRRTFDYVRHLAGSNHQVDVFTYRANTELTTELKSKLGDSRFFCSHETPPVALSMLDIVRHQFDRRIDRALSQAIYEQHLLNPYDVVLVVASEGHWLAEYVKAWQTRRKPRTAIVLMEAIDHVFLLRRDRPLSTVRALLTCLLPILHEVEASRLKSFDLLLANSNWTAEIFRYLYGFESHLFPIVVDLSLFSPKESVSSKPYVALPTASIDSTSMKLAQSVAERGIPLVSFGPKAVPGIPHAGFVDDSAMIRLLSNARATLFLFDYEALGLIPFESLAVGTPVVTYPKEGPYFELRGNPDVYFASDSIAIAAKCQSLISTIKTDAVVARCRASVAKFSLQNGADELVSELGGGS